MQHHSHRFLTHHLPDFSAIKHRVKYLAATAFCLLSTSAFAQDLVLTGVIDGPLSGGIPKAIEVYVINNVADLSNCGLGSANNGGGSNGEEFTFPAVAAAAGSFIYVASEANGFNDFFGFSPDYTSSAASINGDDAIELFCGGLVIDVFGDINVDGSGQPWEYTDGWAYRVNSTGPDGSTFTIANWTFSGPNALDGETTNDTAAVPFPIGTYFSGGGDAAPVVLSTSPANGDSGVALDASIDISFSEDVNVSDGWFDINCSSSGNLGAAVSGGPQTYTLNPDTDFVADEDCTVTVFAALVTDVDNEDPPDNMAADYQFTFDTNVVEPVNLVINEIHADPAGSIAGDANGDGTRDATQDEFVEIVNNDVSDLDISGWTLADGFGVRHTFPAGSVVAQGCSIVVFGGGTPTGSFGKSLVQTASTGALGLNNGGDSVILNDGVNDVITTGYGSEGGDNQSLTLDPDVTGAEPRVKHSQATASGGTLFSPGTKIDGSQFEGCPSTWVINEINADPDLDNGDANGDGTVNTSQDEFVEIVNDSNLALDISGWTLADGFGVRHTFPAGSVVAQGCSVVVFGGGTPTGTFGNGLVQTASSGSLGLNNGGDSVTLNNGSKDVSTASYGSEGGDNQSLTLDPDVNGIEPRVKHSVATGSGGALFSPGTKIDGSQFDGCPVSAEIYEIQGSGASSPLEGNLVLSEDNIVTAVGPNGFFIQTPDSRDDADVNTSNGVYVFTGSAPTVAVGDQVDVSGNIIEFFGFTEFAFGSSVNVDSSGNALPAVTVFDDTVPSPDPTAPSCSIEFECYEGMLVQITGGSVTGPNQRFGGANPDLIAEVNITAANSRTFREPGIEFPGLAGYPEWDGNPEVFELDPDKLGLPNQIIPAGSSFDATGAIGFEFGGYELWPSELTVTPAPLPVAVRSREVAEMTVGALNLFRLYDDIDDPEVPRIDPNTGIEYEPPSNDTVIATDEYLRRLTKFSGYIRTVMLAPDILAVSEVESLKVLQDLADQIKADDAALDYTPYLEEGNDVGGIDVGFLVLDTVEVDEVTQLGRWEILQVPGYDDSLLNDRPPLLLEGRQVADGSDFPIAVIAIHSRSLGGIDGDEADRVQAKRLAQAQFVAQQAQDLQTANPDINLVVAGDFNAFEFSDSYVDVTGQMKGEIVPADNVLFGPDLVDPNLLDQVLMIDPGERYSFIFRGNAQVLDHALTSTGLDELVRDFQFGRGNADAAVDLINDDTTVLRSSDHDGLVLFLAKDSDGDGVTDDADYCPGTVIPEAAPTVELRPNNFALTDDDRIFDTNDPNGTGPQASFDIFDTAGCSCEQIVVEQGLGKGHLKFGCSLGEMEEWVEWVTLP